MPSIPHVARRGAVYYWRRRVPSAFANPNESAILILGLRTSDARRARFLGGQITALADLFLRDPMHQRLPFDVLQTVFRKVFTEHLDKLDVVVTRERMESDFDHEASRRSDVVMGWVFRLLEIRGLSASIDDRAATLMKEAGLDEHGIAEVGQMLDLMRRQGVAAEPAERLRGIVEQAGGIPNPVNLGLVQAAIFRGRSAALFETQRRHDGVRIEDRAGLDELLKQRSAEALTAHIIERDSSDPAHSASIDGGRASADSRTADKPTAQKAGASTEPPPHPLGKRPAIKLAQHPIILLGEKLIEKNARSKAWDEKTQKQARQIYALFAKLLFERGIIEFGNLHQAEFAALDDLLASLNKSYGKSPADADRSTTELRAIGAAKPPAQRGVQPETLNRHLGFLSQLLAYARGQGLKIDRDIDLSLLRGKITERGRDKTQSISRGDLAAIFDLACFTGCAGWNGEDVFTAGPKLYHRALYFAIILLYYTGARREEICGLMVDDVRIIPAADGQAQLEYIDIARNQQRRIKNSQSTRFVPLHPEIIRLGFLQYVEAIRALGYDLAFPDLKSSSSSSPLGDRLYDEFSPGFRLAIPDAGVRKKVLRSFRKTFGNSLKQAGVPSESRGDLLGHSGATVTEEIYADPIALSIMLKEILKLPNVTEHLQLWPVQLLPWVDAKAAPPFSRKARRRPRPA